MDGGPETVADPEETGLLRARALRIYVVSGAGALLLTGVGLLLVWHVRDM